MDFLLNGEGELLNGGRKAERKKGGRAEGLMNKLMKMENQNCVSASPAADARSYGGI